MTVLARWAALAACLAAAGCAAALNGVTGTAGITVREDLRYAAGQRGGYDLYIPEGARADTPIVVFFYGGSWDMGSRDDYLFVGQSLARAGIVAAIPDYRLYPEVTFPGFVEDGARAVATVREAARRGAEGLPPGEHPLFLMGHSAGAQIAALLAHDARYLRAAGVPDGTVRGFVGLAGPYDFLPLTSERYRRIFPEASRAASQPVAFVDASDPPALLITGDADRTVEPRNSRSLFRRIQEAGGRAELQVVPGLGHVEAVVALSTVLPGGSEVRDAVIDFVRRQSGAAPR